MVAGRYVLLDQVGAGGMGSVWRAWDERTRRHVALKVLGQHSSALLARFVREQAVRVRHPHVVAPHGWAAEDDLVVLAMELVPGGSVADLLREHGPLDAGTAGLLCEQLLSGLSAVHGAGLVHRDVKPANLLLEATGDGPPHLRLGDFGVAAPIADRRFTTVPGAIGTDGYMAPEQARGAPPEPTQDLYAVGRVVLEMITGLPPPGSGTSPPTRCARSSSGSSSPTPSSGSPPPTRRSDCSAGCRCRPRPVRRCPTGSGRRRAIGVRAGRGRAQRWTGRAGPLSSPCSSSSPAVCASS